MIVSPLDIFNPAFHFLDVIITEWGVYLFIVFVWLWVLVLVWVFSGRVAPEIFRSTARQRRLWHRHPATHTTAAANHHLRISPAGSWLGLNQTVQRWGRASGSAELRASNLPCRRSLLRNELAHLHAVWACRVRFRAFLMRQCRWMAAITFSSHSWLANFSASASREKCFTQ